MAILATGNSFSTGDNVTATTLNNAVNNATFATGAVDNATTQLSGGAIIVKDGGITPAKLSTGGPSWTTGAVFTTSGFLAGKTTTGAGVVHIADEGANTYNSIYSRNNANSAYIDQTYRATKHSFAGSGAAWLEVASTGTTVGVATTGAVLTFREYTTGSQRDWAIRDDYAINRLRFSRGSSDYTFWDVLKVAASDNISQQIWEAITSLNWKINGTEKMALTTDGLTLSGTVINAANLPTSAAGLASGDLWVDPAASYVVKRVP